MPSMNPNAHTPNCAARIDALIEKAEQENGGDWWCQIALDVLQVLIKPALGDQRHDRYPQEPEDDDHAGCEAAHRHDLALRRARAKFLVYIDREQRGSGVEQGRQRTHQRRDQTCDDKAPESLRVTASRPWLGKPGHRRSVQKHRPGSPGADARARRRRSDPESGRSAQAILLGRHPRVHRVAQPSDLLLLGCVARCTDRYTSTRYRRWVTQ